MNWVEGLRRRLRVLFDGDLVERELSDEIRHHIDLEVQELIRDGWKPQAARREAARRFGGEERTKERVRDERGGRVMTDLVQDLRYAVRSLSRNPGFALSVLLVMALGVGASTALFSVVNGVLLRPLPYPEPHELVRAWRARPSQDAPREPISYLDFEDWRERSQTFTHMGTWADFAQHMTLVRDGQLAEEIPAAWVGGDFFAALGVEPMFGRWIEPRDAVDRRPIAVLSEGAWRRLFGADENIIGTTVTLDFQSLEVVGGHCQLEPVPATLRG